jgi:hypothetical protein
MEQQKKNKKKGEKKLKKKVNRQVAKLLNKGQYHRYLMSINPYLQTLLDPFNTRGVKVPDMVTAPSAPFTIVKRLSVTVNAQGVAGVCMGIAFQNGTVCHGSLVPFNDTTAWAPSPQEGSDGARDKESKTSKKKEKQDEPTLTPKPYVVGQYTGTAATGSGLWDGTDTATGAQTFYFDQWNDTTNTNGQGVTSLFQSARLVSAGLFAEYYGTPLDAKGKWTYVATTRNSFIRERNTVPGIGDLLALPDARVTPINKMRGVNVVYKPKDSVSLNYCDKLTEAMDFTATTSNGQQVFNWNTVQSYLGSEFYIVADGCTPGTSIYFTYIGHYEGIPKMSALSIVDAETSISDPIALSHAYNVVSEVPAASPGVPTQDFRNSSPQVGSLSIPEPAQQDSMFEKVLSGMDQVGNVIDKGVSLAGKIAPLAEGALAMLA